MGVVYKESGHVCDGDIITHLTFPWADNIHFVLKHFCRSRETYCIFKKKKVSDHVCEFSEYQGKPVTGNGKVYILECPCWHKLNAFAAQYRI